MKYPTVNPDTVMERIAEIVRMVAALTSEVCELDWPADHPGRPRMEDAGYIHQRLMLAHAQLARALAPPEEIDAEAQRGLETLKRGHSDLYSVVTGFLADIASYPGDGTWNTHSHLSSRYLLPPEPTALERKRIERAIKVATAERIPRHASWCHVSDEDAANAGGGK